MKLYSSIISNPYIKNVFLSILALLIILFLAIFGIYWHKNNKSIIIPDDFQEKILEAHKAIMLFDYHKANILYKEAIKQDKHNNKILEEYFVFLISEDNLPLAHQIAVMILQYNPNHFLANLVDSAYLINKNKIHIALNNLRIPAQNINSFNNSLFAILSSLDFFTKKQLILFNIVSQQIKEQLPDFYYNQIILYYLLENNYNKAIQIASDATKYYPNIDNIIIYSKLLYMQNKNNGIDIFKEYLGDSLLTDENINNYIKNYNINNVNINYIVSDALCRISKYLKNSSTNPYINPDNILVTHISFMLNNNNPLSRIKLADYYIKIGDYNRALNYISNINKDSFYYKLLYPQICKIYLELGQSDKAISLLKNLYKTDPHNTEVLLELGHIYYKQKLTSQAIKYYSIALQVSKKNKQILGEWLSYYFRGIAYNTNNDWNNAEKDLNQALSINNKDPILLNYLGYSLIDKDIDINKGLKLVKRALSIEPNNPSFLDSYSWGLFKTNNYSKALKISLEAHKKLPLDFSINSHLGDIYWKLNKHKKALLYWNKALNLNPVDSKLQMSLENKIKGNLPVYLAKYN